MTTAGDCPSLRVGHTAVYVRGKAPGDAGKVYVIGGANPSGPFGEAHVLDLNTRTWDTVDCPGLRPRYEHAAFVPACHPDRIYVFGGANQAGNMNDVQVLDTAAGSWSTLTPSASGAAPSRGPTTPPPPSATSSSSTAAATPGPTRSGTARCTASTPAPRPGRC